MVLVLVEGVGVDVLGSGVVDGVAGVVLSETVGEGVSVVGGVQGEGSVMGSTCSPAAKGDTVISALQRGTETVAPVKELVMNAVFVMVFPAPSLFTRPRM